MATTDRTRITKPSPIVEDDQGQLLARQGISREVVSELSKIKGEPDWMAEKRLKALEHNPLCGDELGVHIRVKAGQIEDLRFHGHGCAISQASASIASEELKGMSLQEVGELGADWMIELLGIPVSATRRKCALLNLKVVRGAVTGDHAWPA